MFAALSLMLALFAGPETTANGENAPPPPVTIDDEGVQAWLDRYIKADGWTVFAADGVAVAMGSPSGVTVMTDGTMRAEVRHEYYNPTRIGPMDTRSNLQTWIVDCEAKRVRVVSMQIFALSNLQGESAKSENPQAEWSTPSPGSVKARSVERVCRAPTDGERLPARGAVALRLVTLAEARPGVYASAR